jgi:hypothetical protein
MRPDVAQAFDRMAAAARADGVQLLITSAFRSDAEPAVLFARHPDHKWVARPGESLHRYGTELDLGPDSGYGWLAAKAPRFHFIRAVGLGALALRGAVTLFHSRAVPVPPVASPQNGQRGGYGRRARVPCDPPRARHRARCSLARAGVRTRAASASRSAPPSAASRSPSWAPRVRWPRGAKRERPATVSGDRVADVEVALARPVRDGPRSCDGSERWRDRADLGPEERRVARGVEPPADARAAGKHEVAEAALGVDLAPEGDVPEGLRAGVAPA